MTAACMKVAAGPAACSHILQLLLLHFLMQAGRPTANSDLKASSRLAPAFRKSCRQSVEHPHPLRSRQWLPADQLHVSVCVLGNSAFGLRQGYRFLQNGQLCRILPELVLKQQKGAYYSFPAPLLTTSPARRRGERPLWCLP